MDTNAGAYVGLTAHGRYEEAYALLRRRNPFASVCGRVCAAPCETVCRRAVVDAPIKIRAIKRFVNQRVGIESGRSFERISEIVERPRPRATDAGSVAIVGAGPAGLACAHDLALMGHEVTVFDAAPVAGGMMRLGIPEHRLPRAVLQAEIEFIEFLGVEIRLGAEIGRNVLFEQLAQDYGAVFVAVGCRKDAQLGIPGAELDGVLTAVNFLAHINIGIPMEVGERVVVIGAGNVAYDVARTAQRFGAVAPLERERHLLALEAAFVAARVLGRKVTIVTLESRAEMPADPSQIEEGIREGILLANRRAPKAILSDRGHVRGLQTLTVRRLFDAQHRFAPELVEGSEEEFPCDTVITAIGQIADLSFLGPDHGLAVTPESTIRVDSQTLATSRTGVFAGGDVAFGPRIVIEAVADGRRAALSIDTLLTGRADEPSATCYRTFSTFGYEHPFALGDYEKVPPRRVPLIPIENRTLRAEVESDLDEADARAEGSRCLHCWVEPVFHVGQPSGSECITCGGCADVCPQDCLSLVSRPSSDGSGTPAVVVLLDDSTCIRCGLCARRCPTAVITMRASYEQGEVDLVRMADQVF
ncbi:MAG: FAD-dependent oxidoreductase [Deltaproteobacteria bacterium]|nr:FAD-dependent oxidoreductase [Deltaproteobacteria bacterium]